MIALAPRANESALAEMLATMLRQNLDERPEKAADFEKMRGRVGIEVPDLDQRVTLKFEGGRLTIHGDLVGIPDVLVRTDWESVMQMSLVEIDARTGLPDLRKPVARDVAERSRKGAIEVHGAAANLSLLLRLTRVMSVA